MGAYEKAYNETMAMVKQAFDSFPVDHFPTWDGETASLLATPMKTSTGEYWYTTAGKLPTGEEISNLALSSNAGARNQLEWLARNGEDPSLVEALAERQAARSAAVTKGFFADQAARMNAESDAIARSTKALKAIGRILGR